MSLKLWLLALTLFLIIAFSGVVSGTDEQQSEVPTSCLACQDSAATLSNKINLSERGEQQSGALNLYQMCLDAMTAFLDRIAQGKGGVQQSGASTSCLACQDSATPLLDRIAQGEGTTDAAARRHGLDSAYDVTYDYGRCNPEGSKPVSEMTIGEVKQLQQQMLNNGAGSSAVGKYQFLYTTLFGNPKKKIVGLQKQNCLSDNAKFDATTQELLGKALLEKRCFSKWIEGTISDHNFQKNLAQEWASVADPDTGKSYYRNNGDPAQPGDVEGPKKTDLQHVGTTNAQIKAAMKKAKATANKCKKCECKWVGTITVIYKRDDPRDSLHVDRKAIFYLTGLPLVDNSPIYDFQNDNDNICVGRCLTWSGIVGFDEEGTGGATDSDCHTEWKQKGHGTVHDFEIEYCSRERRLILHGGYLNEPGPLQSMTIKYNDGRVETIQQRGRIGDTPDDIDPGFDRYVDIGTEVSGESIYQDDPARDGGYQWIKQSWHLQLVPSYRFCPVCSTPCLR